MLCSLALELEKEACDNCFHSPLQFSCQEPGGGGSEEAARKISLPALRLEDAKVSPEKHLSC